MNASSPAASTQETGRRGRHGGWITIDSEGGKGSTSWIHLPQCASGLGQPAEIAEPEAVDGASRSLLLVEDEPQVRKALVSALHQVGSQVIEAADGQEALELFDEHCSELSAVILDVDLPKISGLECLDSFHEARPDLPVLVVSGHPVPIAMDERAVDFLPKLFRPSELHSALSRVLSLRTERP